MTPEKAQDLPLPELAEWWEREGHEMNATLYKIKLRVELYLHDLPLLERIRMLEDEIVELSQAVDNP